MGILEKLLETDVEKLKAESSAKFEVKRLSKVLGEPFIIDCKPLTNEEVKHIGEISKSNVDMKLNAIYEVCTIEGRKFNNKELLEKFKVITGKELVQKLLLPGEVFALYNFVSDMSGYGKNAIEEVKN
ncbi:phage tail assembly chaperone [Anaerotignum sp. MB30-C6]|uniref:phage tail assembly chaperone n=1 Tax=Anaerotignum sp. MB30-C6 TaxID=3070814 RepID=UPI0027DE0D40|nr:phage portal protein [Anaerotignum sp. MB30-C6]WMI81599.1 phage portal protein [Anaerotignum sp. MB30-C6]